MTIQNLALADILDRNAGETEAENLLAALADHGVYVPINAEHSVMFMTIDNTTVLPGYVSEECLAQHVPEAAAAVHCDGLRLLDISRQTNVDTLAAFSPAGWAKIPLPLLARTLAHRGQRTQTAQTLKLSWSTHPLAVALRDAARDRLADFPGVRTVWIAQAQWLETGNENLMLHMELAEGAAPEAAKHLIQALMSDHITPNPEDPAVALRVLDPAQEAATIRELNAMGLDTVRTDPTTGRVEVLSHEYD
ncbi:MAG TPA: hypothetical protein VGX23_37945 [Actinocrinis sp.]|nr:hypothetical protein [Actinocrinis sp.]